MTRRYRVSGSRRWTPTARAGGVLGTMLALLMVPPIVLSSSTKSPVEICGGGGPNIPRETLRLGAARDIWLELPAMKRIPILEADSEPADVVIFGPGYDLRPMVLGDESQPGTADTVVCVIQSSGRPTLYANVPLAGSIFAP